MPPRHGPITLRARNMLHASWPTPAPLPPPPVNQSPAPGNIQSSLFIRAALGRPRQPHRRSTRNLSTDLLRVFIPLLPSQVSASSNPSCQYSTARNCTPQTDASVGPSYFKAGSSQTSDDAFETAKQVANNQDAMMAAGRPKKWERIDWGLRVSVLERRRGFRNGPRRVAERFVWETGREGGGGGGVNTHPGNGTHLSSADFDHEEWIAESNKALTLKLGKLERVGGRWSFGGIYRPPHISHPPPLLATVHPDATASTEFAPALTFQVFGEEETIYGYRNLKIKLYYAAGSLATYVGITFSAKAPSLPGSEPQDIYALLEPWLPEVRSSVLPLT
ncbi:histone acetyl transferase HAT1 N-terminus-domain-containing protein [Blyttiomyces helicus]|uniref:Histone acetyltransferase type B catalytic subunit n=1 Tax=Blyttiomyces helicus TaxID=388810 RepID=A0A4P9W7Z4_9FUNG|nr:histone acetyl transferase HAT1 N-terminus-domain-containing protein [Blyttiomyces helicus]|eukprot:RKO88619.1 histone acetyl transferase HAT1 N-terminus-domain-containing protein [Blyttiomyces helicus]